MKAPGTKRLKLEYDELLADFAFNFILRRYTVVLEVDHSMKVMKKLKLVGRGLHSSTCQLKLSRF